MVDLEGEAKVLVSISYENVPCSKCFSKGHPDGKCRSTPQALAVVEIPQEVQRGEGILGKPPSLTVITIKTPAPNSKALASSGNGSSSVAKSAGVIDAFHSLST